MSTTNLPQLQRLIKTDHDAYREEFLQQWNHYNSMRHILYMNSEKPSQCFREIVSFVTQVAKYFPEETAQFPLHLSSILLEKFECLCPETRMTLVRSLVILRKKNVVSSLDLLHSLFPLLSGSVSTLLRSVIQQAIIADIRYANCLSRDHKLNGVLQAMLFGLLNRNIPSDKRDSANATNSKGNSMSQPAMWAVITTKELWRRRIWTENKAISIMEIGCFHASHKVQVVSIHFFLGNDDDESDMEPAEDVDLNGGALCHRRQVSKNARNAVKKRDRRLRLTKRKRRLKDSSTESRFPALQLINDPQTFAEKLYNALVRQDKSFTLDHKILVMKLLSLVVGTHRLFLLGFYTYVLRYLTIHQLRVSAILVAIAQSIHSWTPPDVISPVIGKLAQEFIHPGVGSEVVTAGLNCIREICKRQPCCMTEDLLGDLVEYRRSKDKNVAMAARGLHQLYRDLDPGMLKRSERGATTRVTTAPVFGRCDEGTIGIEGFLLFEDQLRMAHGTVLNSPSGYAKDGSWQNWELESHSSSDSGSGTWIDVVSDGEESFSLNGTEPEVEENGKQELMEDHNQDQANLTSILATTKIFTPADFKLLSDIQMQAAKTAVDPRRGSRAKRNLAALQSVKVDGHHTQQREDTIDEDDITGPRKKAKADYESRISSIVQGREGRGKFSKIKKSDIPKSSTNRQKARNKPLMMIVTSGVIQRKKRAHQNKGMSLKKHAHKFK